MECKKSNQDTVLDNLGIPKKFHSSIHVCENDSSLRATFRHESEVENMLKEWCELAHVSWRVTSTNPNNMSAGRKNIFYKKYHCQHSNIKMKLDPVKVPTSKHVNCKATLTITIKKIGNRCQSKDVHLLKYATKIVLKNDHNHSTNCADSVKYKDVPDNVRDEFIKLFQQGFHPYKALDVFKENLLLKNDKDYYLLSQNRSVCPDITWCYRLYHSIQQKAYGNIEDDHQVVTQKIKDMNLQEFLQTTIFDGSLVIAICTPLMKRVHQLWSYSAEMMFIDSTGNFDKMQHRVFVLLTHSFAGALPLGIIITSTEKGDSLAAGLRLLLQVIGEQAFFKRASEGPAIVMTDHSASERNGIAQVFRNARLLLCTFHILQALWRHLWKREVGIPENRRGELYSLIRQLVYEPDEVKLNQKYNSLMEMNDLMNDKMRKYISDLWKIKEDWAHCYRTGFSRNNNTNNYAETTMRILKDQIFERQKAFNLIQLIEYICLKMDTYYEKKLLDAAVGNALIGSRYRAELTKENLESLSVTKGGDNDTFIVKNVVKDTEYVVDISNEICTCYVGCTGAPCKHQCAVLHYFPYDANNFSTASNIQRRLLHEIATGTIENVPSDWYKPLRISNEYDQSSIPVNDENIDPNSTQEQVRSGQLEPNNHQSDDENDEISTQEQRENIKAMFEKFEELFDNKIKTVAGMRMFQKFFHKVLNYKTNSALEHALHRFGKCSSRKIAVQSTSISRRKCKLGGRNRIEPGRPLKALNNNIEHHYSQMKSFKINLKKHRPHRLEYCITQNTPLGE